MDFATVLETILKVVNFADALGRKFTEGREYRRKRFGSFFGEIFYWAGLVNTEEIQTYHYNINLWSKDEANHWKESYISRCSAICVAAAIFASVGQSALQLDGVHDAHWSASALLTASMVLGILSVVAAVALQNSVTKLSNHREVRLWLSKGIANGYDYPEPYKNLLLESSAATIKLLQAPQLLLDLSVTCYFLGFGLYLLYAWMWAVVEPGVTFRNNFIFYVCVISMVVGYILLFWIAKIGDKDKVNQQFNLKRRFDTGTEDKKMEMLERWTEVVEVLTCSKDEAERKEARQAMEEVLNYMRYGMDGSQTTQKSDAEHSRTNSETTAVKETSTQQP